MRCYYLVLTTPDTATAKEVPDATIKGYKYSFIGRRRYKGTLVFGTYLRI
jgi:hypothetical protein